jgi:membrane-associated protease RseP (regulator of RpoE activity)
MKSALLGLMLAGAVCTAGCATSLHYGMAYVPLQDAKSAAFEPAPKKLDYRQLPDINAIAAAESDMHRDGYVMIGYVNMLSPQLSLIAGSGAQQMGKSVGASRILQAIARGHYLATYWARPKNIVLGAFFEDRLPDEARAAIKDVTQDDGGVLVHIVVKDSPAFVAGIRPGDLLIRMNNAPIESGDDLNEKLQTSRGKSATFLTWSMLEGGPRPVEVALN